METQRKTFLKNLLDAPSPSGFEGPAVSVVREYVKPFADDIRGDVHGNLIVTLNPGGRPKVMLAGHIDEIGLMVTFVDDDGFLGFRPIGGWDARQLNGQRVTVHTSDGPMRGVIGGRAIHLLDQEEKNKVTKLEDLWIDLGISKKEEVEKHVNIGDPVTVGGSFEEFGHSLAISRCFDDKMGTWVVMQVIERLAVQKEALRAEVCAVATVQEEIGLRGGTTSAFGLNPDLGIAVDVTHAMDAPVGGKKRDVGDIKIGSGPTLARGANINPKVFQGLREIAQKKEIPHQIEGAPRGTGTDANVIQLTRQGVAAGLVSVPSRYMHTTVEVISLIDLDHAANLLTEYMLTLGPDSEFVPY